jgi:hypothetical protein
MPVMAATGRPRDARGGGALAGFNCCRALTLPYARLIIGNASWRNFVEDQQYLYISIGYVYLFVGGRKFVTKIPK